LEVAFELFDIDDDSSMGPDELRVVLMAIGRVMSSDEALKQIHQIKTLEDDAARIKDAPNELNIEEFIRLMGKEMTENTGDEELIECFKEFGAED